VKGSKPKAKLSGRCYLVVILFLLARDIVIATEVSLVATAGGNLSNSSDQAEVDTSKNVYFAVRTDGLSGRGTKQDPYDASTAEKCTALLTRLQPDYIFHYAPGIYETYGWSFASRRTAGAGCKHYGAGIDRTIIRLVGASQSTGEGIAFGSRYNERADGFELHDLTIDCNATAQPKWRSGPHRFVTAINTRGSNIRISHVKVTGFGTSSVGTECFPIFIASDVLAGDFSSNVVENCVVTNAATGNRDGTSLISVGPFAVEASGHNNVARNNYIDLSGNDFLYSHGPCAQLVEGNLVKGCSDGVYAEPSSGLRWRVVVRNNDFRNCRVGVSGAALTGSMLDGYLVEGNTFTDCQTMVSILASDSLIHYREIIVRRNRFQRADGMTRNAPIINIFSTDKAIVVRNIVDSTKADPIQIRATHSNIEGNKTSRGVLLDRAD
jgi:Right handed beta helix region